MLGNVACECVLCSMLSRVACLRSTCGMLARVKHACTCSMLARAACFHVWTCTCNGSAACLSLQGRMASLQGSVYTRFTVERPLCWNMHQSHTPATVFRWAHVCRGCSSTGAQISWWASTHVAMVLASTPSLLLRLPPSPPPAPGDSLLTVQAPRRTRPRPLRHQPWTCNPISRFPRLPLARARTCAFPHAGRFRVLRASGQAHSATAWHPPVPHPIEV